MGRFQDGDTAAFETVYARHRGPLYRYFLRQVARSAVDDLFQEVWLRIIKGQARYRPDGPFSAYLYRIAHNVLVDHYRRVGRLPELTSADDLELPDPGAGPERDLSQIELRFLLHQEAGLTLEQIAAVVGVGRETIKSRLRYALNRLRQDLSESEPADTRHA
jgi:RNA polymerase sigma-70 factor (ECF subfamily)